MILHRFMYAVAVSLLPVGASACEYLTRNFELCAEGTPWATGRWVNGGDSAQLYLGTIAFEGYEQYIGSEKRTSLRGALDLLLRETAHNRTRKIHVRDTFSTADLKIVRVISTDKYRENDPELSVLMIAQAPDKSRLELSVDAPSDTPVAEVDRLSRSYAALVRAKPAQEGN